MYAVQLNLHEVALIALRLYEDEADKHGLDLDDVGVGFSRAAGVVTSTDQTVWELCKEHGFGWKEVTDEMNRIAAQTCEGCGVYGVPMIGGVCDSCQDYYGRKMSGN